MTEQNADQAVQDAANKINAETDGEGNVVPFPGSVVQTQPGITPLPMPPQIGLRHHLVALLWPTLIGGAVGWLANRSYSGVSIGALAGAGFASGEAAIYGGGTLDAQTRTVYGVLALASLGGAGYLSFRG